MRTFLMLLAASLSWVSTPTPVLAKNTYQIFTDTLANREARYVQQRAAADARLKAATAAFAAVLDTRTGNLEPVLNELIGSVEGLAFIDGRGMLVRDLRNHMLKKPSAMETEFWMQEHADGLRAMGPEAAARFEALKNGPRTNTRYLAATEDAVTAAGWLRGQLEEIRLIDQNLGSYLRASGAEQAERRERRRQLFAALADGLSRMAVPPPPSSSWSASCSTIGGYTRCSGSR